VIFHYFCCQLTVVRNVIKRGLLLSFRCAISSDDKALFVICSGRELLRKNLLIVCESRRNWADADCNAQQASLRHLINSLFAGQTLMNWLAQSMATASLNEADLSAVTLQYCTKLLNAGVIKQLDTKAPQDTFKTNLMYQWTHTAQTLSPIATPPGRLEANSVWQQQRTASRTRSDSSDSKIPKPAPIAATSTPKPESRQINEIKFKIVKCTTMTELMNVLRSSINESMQSSESSTNSFNGSLLNGSDSTIFDRSEEQTLFNVLKPSSFRTPPRSQRKPRTPHSTPTTPTTATSRAESMKRIRRNASSVDNVATLNGNSPKKKTSPIVAAAAPIKVDKATVMDVEPLQEIKTFATAAVQTEDIVDDVDVATKDDGDAGMKKDEEAAEIEQKVVAVNIPPPPPMPIPIPPPPPMLNGPKIPGESLKLLESFA